MPESSARDDPFSMVPSVQPDRHVEVPGSADLDHVPLAGEAGREHPVRLLAVNDASYRFVDGGHSAGLNEAHRLHRAVAANGHGHEGIDVRDIGLGLVDRAPPLKNMFIRQAAGLAGEVPRLLKGEAL